MFSASSTSDVRFGFALRAIGILTVLAVGSPLLLDRRGVGVALVVYVVLALPLSVLAFREWWVTNTYGDATIVSEDDLRYGNTIRGFIRTDAEPPTGVTQVTAELLVSDPSDADDVVSAVWSIGTSVAPTDRKVDERNRVVVPFSLVLGPPHRGPGNAALRIKVRSGNWITGFAGKFDLGTPAAQEPAGAKRGPA